MGPFKQCELSAFSLILRLIFGQLFLFAGINKFLADGTIGEWAKGTASGFEKTILPQFVVLPYAYALPFIEVIAGALLIAGVATRGTMLFTAFLLLSLAQGMVLQGNYAVAGTNAVYVFIAAVAFLASRWNDYSVDGLVAKMRAR